VHLIQRMKIWKELRHLEHRVREQPSPSTYVDLGQVHINLGDCDKALQVADSGLCLFPDAPELQQLRQFARKSQVKARVQALRAKLDKAPTAKLYRELAALHLELDDFGAVQSVCEECIVRFPGEAEAWLILARARLANFYRDLSAREGQEAVRCLTKVVEIAPDHASALRLLGELFFRIGAHGLARQHLESLRATGQDDPEVLALMQKLGTSAGDEDLEALLRDVEEGGRLRNTLTAQKPVHSGEEGISRIRDALAQLAETRGVRKATYIRGARALVKGEIRDGKDAFLRVTRVVAKASQRFARRLDIGNFNKGVLDGPFGHICICSYGEVVAAVQCDAATSVDGVLADLQELVAASLSLPEGVDS
jgi:tetratricopeptide (TPR) repeat protein